MSFARTIKSLILPLLAFSLAVAAQADTFLKITVQGKGDIVIRLYVKEAPKTTSRITELAAQGFYDGQRFYRVEKSPRPYLVQMGAPDSRTKPLDDPLLLHEGTGVKLPFEESGRSNDSVGVVGLSAEPGNKNSGDAQFYILLAPAKFLDGNYTVFGKVTEGLSVLKSIEKGDAITSVKVTNG
jgi:cyclophilin family peptidyl-prolyl cis-trans isomerase